MLGHALAAAGLEDVAIDPGQARVGVDHDRRHGQHDHGDDRRVDLEAELGVDRAVMGSTMAMTASDGSARHRLAELTATAVCLPVWPMYSPMGSAMARAMMTETAEMMTCSVMRTGMPLGPTQCSGSVSQATVSLTMFMVWLHGRRASSVREAVSMA